MAVRTAMGSAASLSEYDIGTQDERQTELEAFRAVRDTYIKLPPGTDDVAAYDALRKVWEEKTQNAVAPGPTGAPTLHPLVAEALRMTPEEREEVARTVLQEAVRQDARNCPKRSTDYSKSFAGTAQETNVEKEYEALLRGGAEATQDVSPLLAPVPAEACAELRKLGRWMRFLSASGCYMYIHSLTHELVSIRPDEFEDESPDAAGSTEADDGAGGLPSCHLSEVPDVLEEVIEKENMTPLFIDTSPERKLSSYFSYKAIVIDMSPLAIGYAKTGLKTSDLMERARSKTVAALRAGQLLVLDLGQITAAHGNFKHKLCKKDVFPLETFQEGGRKLFTPNFAPRYANIFRDEEKDAGQCMVRTATFRFAVVTSLGPKECEALLSESLPLGSMKMIYVRS